MPRRRDIEKRETILRISDSPTGRKRFRAITQGQQFIVKLALHPSILGPSGPKVGQATTRSSSNIYDSKGIGARGTFSKRRKARIRYWGSNRDPRKYPHRKNSQRK